MYINLRKEHIPFLNEAVAEKISRKDETEIGKMMEAIQKESLDKIEKIREALYLTGSVFVNQEEFELVKEYFTTTN